MSNFNVRLIEDRKNIFKYFQTYKKLFLESNIIESREAVCLMLKAWELVSKDLWEQGYWQDYFRCGDIVLRCTTVVQGDVLNQIGWNYMEKENFALAISYFQESLKLFESMGYLDGQCESLRYFGVLYHRQRRFGSALKSYRKALNLIDRAKINTAGEPLVKQQAQSAEIHNLLGNLYFKLCDFNASRDELTLSLKQYRSLGDEYVYYQPAPLLNLGRWYFLQGNYREARIYYKECLQISHKINRTDTKVGVLTRLAELANAEGDCRKAIKLTERAQRIAGKEIRIQRDKVARLQEEFKGIKISDIHQIKARLLRLFQAGFDFAFYAPLTLLKFILYYFIRILKFRYIAVVSKMRSRYNT
jgi:tetratricopeptide (TPR) repeat protein